MVNELSKSESLDLLAKRRRRILLQLLRDFRTPLPITDLAERIQECESDDPSSRDVMSIQLSLRHSDLSKLEAAGVIAYDETEATVLPDRNFGELIRLLEKVGEEELPCCEHQPMS